MPDPDPRTRPGGLDPSPGAVERSEIEALGATRAELGADYEEALLDSFADKVEAAIENRVHRGAQHDAAAGSQADKHGERQLRLGIWSVLVAIPISIPLGLNDKVDALIVASLGIVGVNAAHAVQGRPRR